jgi:hypothetical protein
MCLTWRHDYGLHLTPEEAALGGLLSGMSDRDRQALYNQMKQVFENCIKPYVTFKE